MKRLVLALLALVLGSSAAFAHVGVGSTASFAAGVSHPFSGLDHMAVMIAVGLWAALKGGRALWVWPCAFVGVMLIGGALGMMHVPVPFVEPGILASVLALGLLVALPGGEPVVSRQQYRVVAFSPLENALVVGRDRPLVSRVEVDLDAGVSGSDLLGHLGAAIRGGVIDDQDPHVDPWLVVQRAAYGLTQEATVVVARNDDADRTHRTLSDSSSAEYGRTASGAGCHAGTSWPDDLREPITRDPAPEIYV